MGFLRQISGLYGRHSVDKKLATEVTNASIDPWQYYGFLVGPMITTMVSPKTSFDLGAFTGVSSTNSPKITSNSQIIRKDDWSMTMPLRLSADLRFGLGNSAFVSAGANYLYMRPKFSTTMQSGTYHFHQTVNTLGINAGIGFSF